MNTKKPSPQSQIGYLIARLCLTQRQHLQKKLTPHGVYVGQEMVLIQLWHEQGITQTELTARVGIQQASITRILNRLVKAGIVRRVKDTQDNRICRVYLTPLGESLQQPVFGILVKNQQRLLKNFSKEEQQQLADFLRRLRENLYD